MKDSNWLVQIEDVSTRLDTLAGLCAYLAHANEHDIDQAYLTHALWSICNTIRAERELLAPVIKEMMADRELRAAS